MENQIVIYQADNGQTSIEVRLENENVWLSANKSSIGQIYQTFDGNDLYPSVEEKASMLQYLVTKNHRSAMATNALPQRCSFGSSTTTTSSTARTAANALPTTLLSPLH